ncbi:hypothetical protein BH708_03870 [Brachybacterium sp. P6-10-X1]|uniref:hypothetical protein n=1 Tax=Brachybacterium sp. P6-10-X1 TaxID=1903186 RepID=UPI000971A240|nr:hypothetical protein [Brachybacterium sp. P6-10-X1]APX32006.1 hypothetical protein BH708_03870 [Brachybacterium sp. P6-10-X1]
MRHVYRITYPNGKIYVGMDLTGTSLYFGSPRKAYIAADLGPEACRDLTIRKEILWESEDATEAEVRALERHFIETTRANDPAIGYNTWPKYTEG